MKFLILQLLALSATSAEPFEADVRLNKRTVGSSGDAAPATERKPHIPWTSHDAAQFNWWWVGGLNCEAVSVIEKTRVELEQMERNRRYRLKQALGWIGEMCEHAFTPYNAANEAQHQFATKQAEPFAGLQFKPDQLIRHRVPYLHAQILCAEYLNRLPQVSHFETWLVVHEAEARMRALQDEWRAHAKLAGKQGSRLKIMKIHRHLSEQKMRQQQHIAQEAARKAQDMHGRRFRELRNKLRDERSLNPIDNNQNDRTLTLPHKHHKERDPRLSHEQLGEREYQPCTINTRKGESQVQRLPGLVTKETITIHQGLLVIIYKRWRGAARTRLLSEQASTGRLRIQSGRNS